MFAAGHDCCLLQRTGPTLGSEHTIPHTYSDSVPVSLSQIVQCITTSNVCRRLSYSEFFVFYQLFAAVQQLQIAMRLPSRQGSCAVTSEWKVLRFPACSKPIQSLNDDKIKIAKCAVPLAPIVTSISCLGARAHTSVSFNNFHDKYIT